MSVLFPANLYGNAPLMYDPNGTMGAGAPTGPNIVRWMLGGRNSLLTVNNSNLGSPPILTYMHFSSSTRFARPGTFVNTLLTRLGPQGHAFPMSLIYPTT